VFLISVKLKEKFLGTSTTVPSSERGLSSAEIVKHRRRDLSLFIIANIFNILTAVILFTRQMNLAFVEFAGIVWAVMIAIVGLVTILNYLNRRVWWTVILPTFFLTFLILELTFDYILNLNFRETQLLWPYLIVFYISQMAMIGFSFGSLRRLGFVTLTTYFVTLLAAFYEVMII
jgi:hypothetical protein